MAIKVCRCLTCPHRFDRKVTFSHYAKRTEYRCNHPDQKYIDDYFRKHDLRYGPGFIGFTKPDGRFPKKTTPKWCPEEKENK